MCYTGKHELKRINWVFSDDASAYVGVVILAVFLAYTLVSWFEGTL